MMTWFRLTLVCGALLGLLLGLTQPADWNEPSPAVRSRPCFDRGNEATSDSPTASVVASMESDPARAGPFRFLVLDCTLSASNIGPPDKRPTSHRIRWALGELPVKPATQTNAIEQPSAQNYRLSTAE
jgi:hypothetical protein